MPEALKIMFYTPVFFDNLAAAIKSVYPDFDANAFVSRIHDDGWDSRELKQRMRHTTVTLHEFLPDDYRAALNILLKVAPMLDKYGFEKIFFPDFVEQYGQDDWEASLPALEAFTQVMSAEFAVRPFIVKDQARMMAQMERWAQHESAQVRRLASEGCRPRLPWAMALPALKKDPSPILPILEHLRHDPSEDVRRSVANNLNDIAKDNPQVVIDTLRRWHAESDSLEMQALVKHALRTLIKAGNPDALALLGYGDQAAVEVKNLRVEPDIIEMHGSLVFSFEVESAADAPQGLMIDYILHLAGANGKTRTKVFKLAKVTLAPGETARLSKPHSFKPITTRRYYPGAHAIEIQINGVVYGRVEFEVR
jgi:3-methyladenine DNA glycosylase AlkC